MRRGLLAGILLLAAASAGVAWDEEMESLRAWWRRTGDIRYRDAVEALASLNRSEARLLAEAERRLRQGTAHGPWASHAAKSLSTLFERRKALLSRFLDEVYPVVRPPAVGCLDSPFFGPRTARLGRLFPEHFHARAPAGISPLEPYDPSRAVVLMIHGHHGSPRDFSHLAENIDRTRFQGWVFTYPGGNPVRETARTLQREIERMAARAPLRGLVVVAHSLGGLITRAMLAEPGFMGDHPYVEAAALVAVPNHGLVTKWPTLVPLVGNLVGETFDASVGDILPESPLLQWLGEQPFPSIPVWTVAGTEPAGTYKISSLIVEDPDDGYLTAATVRLEEAENRTLPADHQSVLRHPDLAALVNRLPCGLP